MIGERMKKIASTQIPDLDLWFVETNYERTATSEITLLFRVEAYMVMTNKPYRNSAGFLTRD